MNIKRLFQLALSLGLALALAPIPASAGICDMDTAELVAMIEDANAEAAAAGLDIAIEAIDCFVIGQGRPPVRILQQPFRWVPNDQRRLAQGDDITFIVDDQNNAGPSSGPASGSFPSQAVRDGMLGWAADSCLSGVLLDERPSPAGLDITIFDGDFPVNFCPGADLPGNGLLNFTAADIVHAGWYPASCFAPTTLAFSVTFIFGGDADGDNYLDTALNEVYYNDAFAWDDTTLGNIDVETVSLHESGHSLGVGHFGPPPDAIIDPVYAGRRIDLQPTDHAGMCTIWSQWPH